MKLMLILLQSFILANVATFALDCSRSLQQASDGSPGKARLLRGRSMKQLTQSDLTPDYMACPLWRSTAGSFDGLLVLCLRSISGFGPLGQVHLHLSVSSCLVLLAFGGFEHGS